MADVFSADGSTLLDVLGQDQSAQRSQLAQYAIIKASQYLRDDHKAEAITAFKQALAFDPQNTTAISYIGNLNLALGNQFEAIKAFKELVRLLPDSVDARMKLGNAYLQDKQYDESEKVYEQAAKLDPTDPLPKFTLGMQYLDTDRLQDAETMFLEVQRLAPGDGNVYYGLGLLYNKQGKHEDAAKNLITALGLKPNFPAAKYELGVAFSNLGMQDEANAQLQSLINDGSSYAADLNYVLDKPRMVSIEVAPQSQFNLSLGAKTPLWTFDASFLTPDTSKVVSVNIQFDKNMDAASVTNPRNWSISKAKGGVAGYYNSTVPTGASEVTIPSTPLAVTYNAYTGAATVSFMINQNATADATIDPGHLVFKFTGKDADGRSMDTSADEIDGAADQSF